jgi:phosphoenolpyruvate-protein kinase (PTS system EI component)
MLLEFVCFAAGVVLGAIMVLERVQACESRTKEQIDADVRKELEFYKNSCNALKDDVAYLRKKVSALKGQVK